MLPTRPDRLPTQIDPTETAAIRHTIAPFQKPELRRSILQLATTACLLLLVLAAMYAIPWSVWWAEPLLAIPAAGLVVRIFIIQHDCGHGSYFRSRSANDVVGWCLSLITFTPYANWRHQHAYHHAGWNNLDRRDTGVDIYSACLTLREYRALPRLRRWVRRTLLHPLVALLALPPIVFLVLYRFPFDTPTEKNWERASVWFTNLALLAVYGGVAVIFGLQSMLLVQLPIMIIASIVGVWLFSIQHRFEHALWARQDSWTATEAALRGSSYLRLPGILNWFTGYIGFHHLHHLAPRIPNYRLPECQRACSAILPTENILSFWQAVRSYRFTLWDEQRNRMIGFHEVGSVKN